MSETPRLALPLVMPSQAQKHVTVNEAFSRLDALTQLVLASVTEATPPNPASEGVVYSVPAGAVNDWAGQEARLALFQAGGWLFVDPMPGWQAFVADTGQLSIWNGIQWRPVGFGNSPSNAGMIPRSVEIDHVVVAGGTSTTTAIIPAGSSVFAITGVVISEITGGATGFQLGVTGSVDRYGAGIGVAAGSWLRGVTGSPLTYYTETALVMTAEGGSFSGGVVRLVAHVLEFTLPSEA